MRSHRTQHNLVAVSANNAETAINTSQTLDTSMLVDMGDVANLEPRREANVNELTGLEEPDTIYDLGDLTTFVFNHPKAQPQHFAFLLAFALSSISTAAAGTGYQHTITPLEGDVDDDRSLESFTMAMRYGLTVAKRRFYSMFVDDWEARFPMDDWVSVRATARGTGKFDSTLTEESITAANDATSLNLAANAVQGSTAQARLDSVHRVRMLHADGHYVDITPSAVSDATPAVITIPSQGGDSSNTTYKVLYSPTEPAWASFPSRVSETPLRVSEATFTLGGTWDGSSFDGGKTIDADIREVSWQGQNDMAIEFIPGASGSFASRAFRQGRMQTVSLGKYFRDYILQNYIDQNETFGLYILAEGAVYDSPHKYQVEIIFPKLGVLTSPISADGKRLAEAGDLQVLQDSTYGSVIVKVKNLVATYAA